jgi:hypothetical protein
LAAAATGAAARGYPERVVQIIVPSPPGSSAHIMGRILADGFSTQFGKRFIVVDMPGYFIAPKPTHFCCTAVRLFLMWWTVPAPRQRGALG